MVGRRVVSDEQQEILVNYFAENSSFLKTVPYSGQVLQARTKLWRELSSILNNASTGCQKTPNKWRDYWNGLKYTARQKTRQIASSKTPIKLSHIEQRMIAIMTQHEESVPQNPSQMDPKLSDKSSESSQSSSPPHAVPLLVWEDSPPPPEPPNHRKTPNPLVNPIPPQVPKKNVSAIPLGKNFLPLQVVVATANLSKLSFETIKFIERELQQCLWEFMANPTINCQPEFEFCSKLEPIGLSFKCCNRDALEWLTVTIKSSPFKEHDLIVFLDTPATRFPSTVDMCVELTSEFEVNQEARSVFDVLVRTNKSWLDTAKWTMLDDECLPTANLTCPAKLRVVFRVPLSDIPTLRDKGFKLYFLFKLIDVKYLDDLKADVPQDAMHHEVDVKVEVPNNSDNVL